jgi:threonine/homoserine/homoserine lactone efflux protein
MFEAILTIIFTSLSGVIMPGPMFTMTLAKSHISPWIGVQVSLGHAVIEVPLVFLIYFGLADFFQEAWIQIILSLIGGGMIIWMSIGLYRNRKSVANVYQENPYSAFIAGILLSGLNPFFLMWWITVGSMLLMNFLEFSPNGIVLFIIFHWICDFVWLSLISITTFKMQSFLNNEKREWIYIILSIILLYFGGNFIIKGINFLL